MESPLPLNTTVFIYALTEPTGEIRYIGKATDPARRFSAHLRAKGNNHRACWIRSLRSQGLSPLWKVLDEVSIEYWQQWEAAYIQFFLEEGCNLVNSTKGGEGGATMSGKTHAQETKEIMSAALTGRKFSQGHRKNLSAAMTGRVPWNKGLKGAQVGWNKGLKNPQAGRAGEKNPMFGKVPWNKGLTGFMAGEKNPMFGRTGDKAPMFGRSGEKHPNFGKKRSSEGKYE